VRWHRRAGEGRFDTLVGRATRRRWPTSSACNGVKLDRRLMYEAASHDELFHLEQCRIRGIRDRAEDSSTAGVRQRMKRRCAHPERRDAKDFVLENRAGAPASSASGA